MSINSFNEFTINANRERYSENLIARKPSKKDAACCQARRRLEAIKDRRAIEREYSVEGLFDE
ncbi:hypothetical protein [Pseudoalteromonas 'SMAR']|uniref:hypothetical protein n=1 Tax=Pseudoalteromonas 'SMAR' TaxID=3416908 RepID=UPI003AF295FB